MRVRELMALLATFDEETEVRVAWSEFDTDYGLAQDLPVFGCTTQLAPPCPVPLRKSDAPRTVWLFASRYVEVPGRRYASGADQQPANDHEG